MFRPVNKLQLEQEIATDPAAINRAKREMLRARAVELAVLCGRSAQTMEKGDWEQARREFAISKDRACDLPPVSEPALERWENEGGGVLDSAGCTVNVGETPIDPHC